MGEMTHSFGDHPRVGKMMRIAFLHIAPRYDNIQYNLLPGSMDFDESWQPRSPHFTTYPIESEA